LADVPHSKCGVLGRVGSSPTSGTTSEQTTLHSESPVALRLGILRPAALLLLSPQSWLCGGPMPAANIARRLRMVRDIFMPAPGWHFLPTLHTEQITLRIPSRFAVGDSSSRSIPPHAACRAGAPVAPPLPASWLCGGPMPAANIARRLRMAAMFLCPRQDGIFSLTSRTEQITLRIPSRFAGARCPLPVSRIIFRWYAIFLCPRPDGIFYRLFTRSKLRYSSPVASRLGILRPAALLLLSPQSWLCGGPMPAANIAPSSDGARYFYARARTVRFLSFQGKGASNFQPGQLHAFKQGLVS
jgi:hypothetical protein